MTFDEIEQEWQQLVERFVNSLQAVSASFNVKIML